MSRANEKRRAEYERVMKEREIAAHLCDALAADTSAAATIYTNMARLARNSQNDDLGYEMIDLRVIAERADRLVSSLNALLAPSLDGWAGEIPANAPVDPSPGIPEP